MNTVDQIIHNSYAIGRTMKVRKLQGVFKIFDSWMVGKMRRYKLHAIDDTGAIVGETEAFGEQMEPYDMPAAPQPVAHDDQGPIYKDDLDAQALRDGKLRRDTSAQEQAPSATGPGGVRIPVAPDGAQPLTGTGPGPAVEHDAGTFGGELDEYAAGAQERDAPGIADTLGKLRDADVLFEGSDDSPKLEHPYRALRHQPRVSIEYQTLNNILYQGRFSGLEKYTRAQFEEVEDSTPVAVVVTKETNGCAVWIITIHDRYEIHQARLEVFYLTEPGVEAMAIEHGVMLALRKIPIRTNDLEILLLQLI